MDIGNAFSYIFKDEKWLEKVLLGGFFIFLCIFIIPAPFLGGYMVELMGNVARGEERPLPAWDRLAGKYKNGLLLILINLAYMVPSILLRIIKSINKFVEGPAILGFWLTLLVSVYQLLILFVQPAATLHFALSKRLGDAFDFERILGFVSRNFVNLLIIFLVNILLALIAGSGLILLLIGVIFTSFYAFTVRAYLYGNLYREEMVVSQESQPTPAA